jgi:hypothetical protein
MHFAQKHPDLVVLRAGKHSVHPKWRPGIAAFDLIVSGYEDLPIELTQMAAATLMIPGPKIASWGRLFGDNPHLLDNYEQIALLDDDLLCSIDDINTMFAAGRTHGLLLWQPSLAWDGYYTYGITLNNPFFYMRYVNFIELMCPFFANDQLKMTLPLFSLGYEIYIDRLWCRLNANSERRFAIVDAVTFRHCRPVAQNAQAQGFSIQSRQDKGGVYQPVIDQIEAELAVRFRGPVAYAGILRTGRIISGRLIMAVTALAVLRGWRQHIENKFIEPVLDHVRHNLTRPIDNEPIAISRRKS